MASQYQALILVSFGGPEGPEQVLPFLENVLRGRRIPRERILEVAKHYQEFGGISPLNEQNRTLIAALKQELHTSGLSFPVYFGNRNWHPYLSETLAQMRSDGIERALAFFTSAYSSYSGCRQYLEDIAAAQEEIGAGAPVIDKLRAFYNHPGFVGPNAQHVAEALAKIPSNRQSEVRLVFCAHSIPLSMAAHCAYQDQLKETARLVAEQIGIGTWDLVYQSRSGPPHQPWLEPDICDHLQALNRDGITDVVVAPIGFISDHLEVLYDLDQEAQQICAEQGMNMVRAATVGIHPDFVRMIRQLIEERMGQRADRPFLGMRGPSHDVCPEDCCLPGH